MASSRSAGCSKMTTLPNSFGASERRYSRRMTLNNELWTFSPPLYSMKPSLLNLFMKKLTRGRVVPIISASVPWLIFAVTGSGLPSLPKFASSRRVRAKRFSLELSKWSTRSASTRLLRSTGES